jgi:hypothetical protein
MTARNVKSLDSVADLPKIDPAQYVGNDTGMTPEEVQAHFAAVGAVEINYGNFGLVCERADFEKAKQLAAKASAKDRPLLMQSIDEELRKNLKIVEAGKATREIYDMVYADMVLWSAFQEYRA